MIININLPSSWNDLTPSQLKRVSWLLSKDLPAEILQILLFFVLYRVKWFNVIKIFKAVILFYNVPIKEITKTFDFIYKKVDLTTFIPIIKIKNVAYHAPAARLSNITIDEFAHADAMFLKYYNTKNLDYLEALAAILYREVEDYDVRLPFVKDELNARIERFENVDRKTLFAIYRSYQGCRFYIEEQFPRIFPKSEAKKKKKKKPPESQFAKLILDLANGKFGIYQETAKINVYIFLSDFQNQLINQYKK